jgi:tRNA A-37 threonylcarbamoyl transferase component Bud32
MAARRAVLPGQQKPPKMRELANPGGLGFVQAAKTREHDISVRAASEGRVTVDVGQILDKYELLEKVGQGGMAVVYRGLDRSLKREVAVKVLHKHLAEHQEARDRFEREAHAVAKLRHENILEIFDFSGGKSDESYIVTEFIDGQTLKQFVTDHVLEFPEVAAMIAVQVCKALGHAHSLGILHRDIKPENIMIRNDGVVKLMDFGISQMLDLQRMTVTGQLLGSPAYMSPEHVEGGQLDFRTDVFAVGIVLYQLITNQLPFQGKNPHEILKRIAEGRHPDIRQVNPRVGKQLGAIVSRALEREQKDRFDDVSQMLAALERYLEGSGLTNHREELARFFAAPVSYEMALRARLVDHLTRRGRELLVNEPAVAIELFDRVLTIDPDNAPVLAEIDKLSRRRRTLHLGLLALGVVAAAGAAYGVRAWMQADEPAAIAAATLDPADAGAAMIDPLAADASLGLAPDASALTPGRRDAGTPPDGRTSLTVPVIDRRPRPDARARRPARADASVAAAPALRRVTLSAFPPNNAEYRVDGGPWQPLTGGRVDFEAAAGTGAVDIRNPTCCEEERVAIPPGAGPHRLHVQLGWLPARITPTCEVADASVQVAGGPARLGRAKTVPIGKQATGEREVEVVFFTGDGKLSKQQITVQYGEDREVTCSFD